MFCRRCGRPGHMQANPTCPNIDKPKESWPCIVCAEKHPCEETTKQCPNRGNKGLHRCLNCKEANLDDTNHRTDFHKCPAPTTVEWRVKWRILATVLPDWAVGVNFPTVDHLRTRVEQGMSSKGTKVSSKSKSKSDTNVDNTVQAEGSGAGSGTRTLNRKGLMRSKESPKTSPEAKTIDSDDDMEDVATKATGKVTSSCPTLSQSTTVDGPSRKAGHSSRPLSILVWAKPIGNTTKSSSNIPPSSSESTDAIPPACEGKEDEAMPKRKRGRPRKSAGRKRTRSESDTGPEHTHSKPRVGSYSREDTTPSAEQDSPSVQAADISESGTSHEADNDDPYDLSQYLDDDPATTSDSEDGCK